jgi:hypothetical protein
MSLKDVTLADAKDGFFEVAQAAVGAVATVVRPRFLSRFFEYVSRKLEHQVKIPRPRAQVVGIVLPFALVVGVGGPIACHYLRKGHPKASAAEISPSHVQKTVHAEGHPQANASVRSKGATPRTP